MAKTLRSDRLGFRSNRLLACLTLCVLLSSPGRASDPKGWFRTTVKQIQSSPCIADLNGDGKMEILLVDANDQLQAWNRDGTGFSFTVGSNTYSFPMTAGFVDGSIGSVSVGDVDGSGSDAFPEIVICGDDTNSKNAKVCIYDMDAHAFSWITLPSSTNASGKSTAALIDCFRYGGTTQHPAKEIVVRTGDGSVYVYAKGASSWDEKTSSGWDTATDAASDRNGAMPITSSPAAYKVDTDTTRIIVSSTDGKIYYWNVDSNSTSGGGSNWTVASSGTIAPSGAGWFLSSPVAADLGGDGGGMDVVAGNTDKKLYAWNSNGTALSGWPKTHGGWIVSSPAVADLDGNGDLEVVVGCDDGKVYAFEHDGGAVEGWPQETGGPVFGSPAIGELDGQPGLEIVAASFDRRLYAWHSDGTPLGDWPKRFNSPFYSSPAIGDLDGDGRMSIVSATFNGKVCVWDLAPKSLNTALGWPQFRGGATRTGAQ